MRGVYSSKINFDLGLFLYFNKCIWHMGFQKVGVVLDFMELETSEGVKIWNLWKGFHG